MRGEKRLNTVYVHTHEYTVLSQLRKTGGKALYLARSETTGQQVVLCKLLEGAEAYSLLQLIRHENLVRVLDVETHSSGVTYAILEHVDAPLLSDAMQQKQFTQQEVIRIGMQLCGALYALHRVGLIHRDVKPENIFLLADGTVKLSDFDASRIFKTSTGSDTTPMGTFGYAAPEQFGLKQSDARSDIYALGILLNTLAIGEHPSVRLCKGMLRRIVLRCTHLNSEQRYRNAVQVQHALQNCLLMLRFRPAALLMAAVTVLLLLTVLLPKPAPAPQTTPAAAPSPSPTISPLPTPTAHPLQAQLPPAFEEDMSSVREVIWGDNTYYLFLSTEATEQFAPRPTETERRVYLPENSELPLYLYILPYNGDLSKIPDFRSYIKDVSCRMEAAGSPSYAALTLDGFGLHPENTSNLLAEGVFAGKSMPAGADSLPLHHLVTVTVEFTDGKTVPLQLSATLHPNEIILNSGSVYPMDTAEQLNVLLDSLDALFGPDAPITLQLPQTVYTEKVILPGRSAALVGAENGTVFRSGLRINKSFDSSAVSLSGIIFQGSGSGTAITSQRALSLSRCTFNDHAACYSVPENVTVTGDSIAGNVSFTENTQPAAPDLTTAAGLNAYLANPPGELANLVSFTVQLPAVVYDEEVVIDRAVSLEGAGDRGTVFLAGLRYTGEVEDVTVRNCTFQCRGRETAVLSSRDILIENCSLFNFTYAAAPVGDAEIRFLDCDFDHTHYLLPEDTAIVRD